MVAAESVRPRAARTASQNLLFVRASVVILAWFALLLPSHDMRFELFYGLSGLLLAYLCFEIRNLPQDPFVPKILNPIVIASIGTYGCSMGAILNFLIFADDYTRIDFAFIAPMVNSNLYYAHFAMTLACTAAVLTWVTYYGNVGEKLYEAYFRLIPSAKFLGGEFDSKRLLLIVIVAIAIRCFLFRMGLHGRIVSSENFGVGGFVTGTEYRHLGTLCYVAVALTFLGNSRQPSPTNQCLCWVLLANEAFFGFMYGARSAIVYPFIIAFVTQSYCMRQISRLHLALMSASLVFAMSVGNEFKTYALETGYQEEMGVLDLFADFLAKRDEFAAQQDQTESINAFVVNFARNKSKVAECAAAIQFASTSSSAANDWFRENARSEFLASPLHGFLIRRITGISRPQWGLRFKNVVLKRNVKSRYSVGFSPIGFLYFTGGTIVVLLGAACYGIALRFTLFIVRHGDLGFLLYLALMSKLYDVHTVAPELIINGIRYLVFLPIIFWFLFKK